MVSTTNFQDKKEEYDSGELEDVSFNNIKKVASKIKNKNSDEFGLIDINYAEDGTVGAFEKSPKKNFYAEAGTVCEIENINEFNPQEELDIDGLKQDTDVFDDEEFMLMAKETERGTVEIQRCFAGDSDSMVSFAGEAGTELYQSTMRGKLEKHSTHSDNDGSVIDQDVEGAKELFKKMEEELSEEYNNQVLSDSDNFLITQDTPEDMRHGKQGSAIILNDETVIKGRNGMQYEFSQAPKVLASKEELARQVDITVDDPDDLTALEEVKIMNKIERMDDDELSELNADIYHFDEHDNDSEEAVRGWKEGIQMMRARNRLDNEERENKPEEDRKLNPYTDDYNHRFSEAIMIGQMTDGETPMDMDSIEKHDVLWAKFGGDDIEGVINYEEAQDLIEAFEDGETDPEELAQYIGDELRSGGDSEKIAEKMRPLVKMASEEMEDREYSISDDITEIPQIGTNGSIYIAKEQPCGGKYCNTCPHSPSEYGGYAQRKYRDENGVSTSSYLGKTNYAPTWSSGGEPNTSKKNVKDKYGVEEDSEETNSSDVDEVSDPSDIDIEIT